LALAVKITDTPAKYLRSLDKPTQTRIIEKLKAIAENHLDSRLSYPLVAQEKRCTRVGRYRVLFEVFGQELIVSDIGPRGQIYRRL
jgi:mRNA-degrading endonuclease RelE of RelBE toxin-antitoxin system